MTFVLGDKLAGVTLVLQLVNLGVQAGTSALIGRRATVGTAGAHCQPPALPRGVAHWGHRRDMLCPQAPPCLVSSPHH